MIKGRIFCTSYLGMGGAVLLSCQCLFRECKYKFMLTGVTFPFVNSVHLQFPTALLKCKSLTSLLFYFTEPKMPKNSFNAALLAVLLLASGVILGAESLAKEWVTVIYSNHFLFISSSKSSGMQHPFLPFIRQWNQRNGYSNFCFFSPMNCPFHRASKYGVMVGHCLLFIQKFQK